MSGGGKAVGKALEIKKGRAVDAGASEEIGNPDLGVQVGEPELKASDAFEELAANEKIPQETREAFAIQAKHQRDLESKPPNVSEEAHLKAIAEIELKMEYSS